jgi:hypothetical protein
MRVAGASCVDWKEREENGWLVQQITTRAGLVRYETSADEAALVCDDGTRYVTSDPLSLLDCAPSRLLEGSADAVDLSLGVVGEAGEVHVFTCLGG